MAKDIKIVMRKEDKNVLNKFENSKEMLDFSKDCWTFICESKLQTGFWLWQAQRDIDEIK